MPSIQAREATFETFYDFLKNQQCLGRYGEMVYNEFMALTAKFKSSADIYQDYLDDDLVDEMKKRGYVFLSFSWVNDNPPHPTPSWRSILYNIGEEDDFDGDFAEKDPAFTVTHKESNITVTGNGSVSVMSELWIKLKDAGFI